MYRFTYDILTYIFYTVNKNAKKNRDRRKNWTVCFFPRLTRCFYLLIMLIFSGEIKYISAQASSSSYEGLEHIIEALEKAKVRLKANVNFELTMELLLLTIKEN